MGPLSSAFVVALDPESLTQGNDWVSQLNRERPTDLNANSSSLRALKIRAKTSNAP